MKNLKLTNMLFNRDAYLSSGWSVIQQIIVAFSTYFIVESIRHTTSGDVSLGIKYVFAFVICLVVVYLPNTVSMVYLQKWRLTSIEKFIETFINFNKGKTSFGHSRNKSKHESWLTNEMFTVFDNATNLIYQILSTLMNSVFNIIVIAVVIDMRIIGWYLIAGLILILSNHFFRNKISDASINLQDTRKELSSSMLSSWQNIFIGNHYNLEVWQSRFLANLTRARKSAVAYDLVRSLISSGTVVLAMTVIAIGNAIFIIENIGNVPLVASLLMTLPRQLQIIQSIFALFNLSLSWAGVRQQLNSLGKVIVLSQTEEDCVRHIKFDQILFSKDGDSNRTQDLSSVLNHLFENKTGRFTIRGSNGVGKSTLLSLTKELSGETSFLLPTNFEDLSFDTDFLNHSDGNRLLAVFQKIATLDKVKLIILDEWDANLDAVNTAAIDKAIDEISQTRIVLESRHRC